MSSNTPTLLPHAPVTPLSTVATSVVPEGALAIIEWCVFDDIPQKQVVKLYNDADYGNIQSHHGVSKQLMRYATRWYEEQGAVSPWKCKTDAEKKEEKKKGLDKEDFPFVHPRDLAQAGQGQGQGVVANMGGVPQPQQAQQQQSQQAAAGLRSGRIQATGNFPPKPKAKAPPKPLANAPPKKSLIIKLLVTIPPGHPAYVPPRQPIPDNLKQAILDKHSERLAACTTGRAELADPVEEELDGLETVAKEISLEGFKAWKFGERGYGN